MDRLDGQWPNTVGWARPVRQKRVLPLRPERFKVLGGSFAMAKYIAKEMAGTSPR